MSDDINTENEFQLVATALLAVQRFEFIFYSLVTYIPKKNSWTYDEFVRGDLKQFTKTLGILKRDYAIEFLIDNPELDLLIDYRNTLCHNYFRMTFMDIRDGHKLKDPIKFLKDLIEMSNRYTLALLGFIALIDKKKIHAPFSKEGQAIAIYKDIQAKSVLRLEGRIDEIFNELNTIIESKNPDKSTVERKYKQLMRLINLHPE